MNRDKLINEETKRYMIQIDPKPGRFNILPKVHQQGNTGRPIVSSNSYPTERISQFVDSPPSQTSGADYAIVHQKHCTLPIPYLTKFNTGRLRHEVPSLTLLYTILVGKVPLLYTFYLKKVSLSNTYFRKSCSHFHVVHA